MSKEWSGWSLITINEDSLKKDPPTVIGEQNRGDVKRSEIAGTGSVWRHD